MLTRPYFFVYLLCVSCFLINFVQLLCDATESKTGCKSLLRICKTEESNVGKDTWDSASCLALR